MANLRFNIDHKKVAYLTKFAGSDIFHQIIDFLNELVATIDGHEHTISEATIRTSLHLDDLDATDVLPNQEIFDGLQAIGYRPDGPWVYNFSRYIFQGMVSNVSGRHMFLMYPRFVQLALNITPTDTTEYVFPSFTSKVFVNLRYYEGLAMPLLAAMLPQVAQTNPLEGPPIAPQADEPIPDPAHAPNVEEPISSPALKPVVQHAQQHHEQATGGSLIYEHPPIPNPVTPPVSTTEGAAEVPFTIDQMLALFPMCLQKIDALEKELKATKNLNRDTVLLFHKRIKKLEAKIKTKSKRKLVISDSEKEEAAKDYSELEKLIHLAEAAVNEPSSFVTPSKTTAADSSQNEDISPFTVEATQILTEGKLDPSKISKSPTNVAQRSVQTFVRKRSTKSTQGLDYSDVDFSPKDSVATDRSVPAEKVVPADKGVSVASSNKGKGIADEEERKKRLADLSKSDSEYAKLVAQTMETSNAEPTPQVPTTGDDLIAEYNKIKSAVERSTNSQGVKRSRPILARGSPKKMKSTVGPSLGYTPADEVPADTGVSTDEPFPVDQRVPADQGVPADASIPAVTGVSTDDTVVPSGLGTIHTLLCYGGVQKSFITLREILHMVDRQTLIRLYGFVDALSKKQPLDGLALSQAGDNTDKQGSSSPSMLTSQAITTRSGLVLDGPSVHMPPPFTNPEEDERVEKTLTDPDLAEYTIKVLVQKAKPLSQRNYVLQQRDPLHPNIPYPSRMYKQKQQDKDEIQIHMFWKMFKQLHINITLGILKKLPKKLRDPGKFLIPCGFSELKCKALANLGASINLMPLSVWKKLCLPELISTRITLELANRVICTPAGIARDVFVSIGKFTFPADFVIVNYESDPRVPLILGRPFLWTARALIDVHREEMILRDGDERLTLNMRHDTSSYSNQPQKESINMINCYDDSFINPLSGNPTSSSPDHLLKDSANDLALITFPPGNDDLPFDIKSELREIEYLLNHDPTKEMDSILKDLVDECNLADPNKILLSDNDNAYNDLFNSKEDKIKESKLLIDEIDPPRSSDFIPSPEYDSFLFEDFFRVIVQIAPDKNVKKMSISYASLILEDFDPPLYETKKFPGMISSKN
nr:hypothetical protein [Tanacetum cinerariifolium]